MFITQFYQNFLSGGILICFCFLSTFRNFHLFKQISPNCLGELMLNCIPAISKIICSQFA